MAELSAVVERLARVMDPEYIPVWMYEPIPALEDEKLVDLLAGGDYRRLAQLISELESPTFSYGGAQYRWSSNPSPARYIFRLPAKLPVGRGSIIPNAAVTAEFMKVDPPRQ